MTTRRLFVGGATAAIGFAIVGGAFGKQVIKEIANLKPGEFTWHPERSPSGPVSVVVSIPEQLVHVYRNGVRIAVSTCSTGKPGHETPTGVFVVLEKDKHHRSSTYNNAPMPNENRLTWSGIALHAGNLPGYPASHGCVRLPFDFSERLFTVTHLGTPVIIAGAHTDPWDVTHPGMVLSGYAESEFKQVLSGLEGKKHPSDWQEGEAYPVSTVIISSADREAELVSNNDIVAKSKVTIKGHGQVGSHVFVLNGANEAGRRMQWTAISHHSSAGVTPDSDVLNRITADNNFIRSMQEHMHPGMIMILTDLPLSPDRRSGKDFVVVSSS